MPNASKFAGFRHMSSRYGLRLRGIPIQYDIHATRLSSGTPYRLASFSASEQGRLALQIQTWAARRLDIEAANDPAY